MPVFNIAAAAAKSAAVPAKAPAPAKAVAPVALKYLGTKLANGSIREMQCLKSPNNRYVLALEKGNLTLKDSVGNRTLWQVGPGPIPAGIPSKKTNPVVNAAMQSDGNFVTYDAQNRAVWSSDTQVKGAPWLRMQDDANFCVVDQGGDSKWDPFHGKKTGGNVFTAIASAAKTVANTANDVGKAAIKVTQTITKPLTNNIIWTAAQTGVSFIPGVGTAVSTAMSVTAAVGRGESALNIGLAAARGACPGGALVQAAFDIGVGVAKGQRLDAVALSAARGQVERMAGPLGVAAFDTAQAIAGGKSAPAAAAAHAAVVKQNPAAAQLAGAVSTYANTHNAAVLVADIRAKKPEAAKAVLQLKAAADQGNPKAAAAIATMNVVAKVQSRQINVLAKALPRPALNLAPKALPAAAAVAAPVAAAVALTAAPAPVAAAATALAVAPAAAPARRGFVAKIKAAGTAQRLAYVRGTTSLQIRTARPQIKHWHGILKTTA